jgi:SAM-dependent methyltransferase
VIPGPLDRALGAAGVATLLALSQPRFFATLGALDWYSDSHRRWIDEQNLRPGVRVLEIGCATGVLTTYMVESGAHVSGVDRSADMIRRGRKAHPGLDLRVGDAMRLPFDDNAFDRVVSASVVNIVADAGPVLSEMHRVCAPGGTVSVLVPSADFKDNDLDVLVDALGLTGFSRAALTKWHRGPRKMSPTQLQTLLGSVGLEPTVTRKYLDGMLVAVTATSCVSPPPRLSPQSRRG